MECAKNSHTDVCLAYIRSSGGCAVWVGLCQQSSINPFSNLSIKIIAVM